MWRITSSVQCKFDYIVCLFFLGPCTVLYIRGWWLHRPLPMFISHSATLESIHPLMFLHFVLIQYGNNRGPFLRTPEVQRWTNHFFTFRLYANDPDQMHFEFILYQNKLCEKLLGFRYLKKQQYTCVFSLWRKFKLYIACKCWAAFRSNCIM